MVTGLIIFQYFSVLVVLAAMSLVVQSRKSENQTILILIFASNLINQLGTALSMQASSLDGALTGLKMAYYGKIWVLFFTMYFTVNYCGYPIKNWVLLALNALQFAILGFVFTCEKHSLYYTSIEYVTEEGIVPHLKTSPGIVHHIFFCILVSYMVAIIVVCFKKFTITEDKRERSRVCCLFVVPVVILISYTFYKTGLTHGYDCTSVALLIDTVIIVYALRKLDLIDYVSLAKEELIDEFSDGVIVLDSKKELVYKNKQALLLFPDLEGTNFTTVIKKLDDLYEKTGEIWVGTKMYTIRKKKLKREEKVLSIIYTLTDNTTDFILNYVDVLTDVKNRRALMNDSEDKSFIEDSWIVFMDIDNFKDINDSKGHQVGDECLVDFANELCDTFSKLNVYRLGGDEFIVVWKSSLEELEEKLRSVNEKLSSSDRENPVKVSGGFVKYDKGQSIDLLLKRADDALYEVKKSGKGRFAMAK